MVGANARSMRDRVAVLLCCWLLVRPRESHGLATTHLEPGTRKGRPRARSVAGCCVAGSWSSLARATVLATTHLKNQQPVTETPAKGRRFGATERRTRAR